MPGTSKISIKPLTIGRWADIEALFGARGCAVARSCWCMYYRRAGRQAIILERKHDNRLALKSLVDAGEFTGLLAYRGKTPVGWLSLGPREGYQRLLRSPVMRPVDDEPVWSIICFVVPPAYRGQGVAHALLQGAVAYAKKRRVEILEAYPVDRSGRSDDASLWFGAKAMYDRAGFSEVARRKPTRAVVRLRLA